MIQLVNGWGLILIDPDEETIKRAEALNFEKKIPWTGAANEIYLNEEGEYIYPDEPFWFYKAEQPGFFGGSYEEISEIEREFKGGDLTKLLGFSAEEIFGYVDVACIEDNTVPAKYVLSACDSFELETTVYETLEQAQAAMRHAYNLLLPKATDGTDSFLAEENATLYTEETVYNWLITEVLI